MRGSSQFNERQEFSTIVESIFFKNQRSGIHLLFREKSHRSHDHLIARSAVPSERSKRLPRTRSRERCPSLRQGELSRKDTRGRSSAGTTSAVAKIKRGYRRHVHVYAMPVRRVNTCTSARTMRDVLIGARVLRRLSSSHARDYRERASERSLIKTAESR